MSDEKKERYQRQIMLPEVGLAGQERLGAARVVVVGAGGLGSVSCLYLAAAGVGTLVIADPDRVSLSNLNRQILHGTPDLGLAKTESARYRLKALNPHVRIECHASAVTDETAPDLIRGATLVVDGTDNRRARRTLNRACLAFGVPFVFGGVQGFDGMVMTVLPGKGPCFECLFPGEAEPPPSGVLGPVPGLVASIQTLEAIKLILGRGESLAGRLLSIRGLAMSVRDLRVRQNPDCPACGGTGTVAGAIREATDGCRFRERTGPAGA
jgi:adenylyltransferase/sulfurtransferase